jgi:hypothetical protein
MAKNKNRIFKLEDRAFSLSSTTSPAHFELQTERQDQHYQDPNAYGGRVGKGAFGGAGGVGKKY